MKLLMTSLLVSLGWTQAHQVVLGIHGSGTTNPSKCFWIILEQFTARSKHPIRLSYRAIGSTSGIEELVNGYSATPAMDFGSGDLPLNTTAYEALNTAGNGVIHLPVLLGAVSFFHSVPNTPNLNLTGCLLARIFTRQITKWNDDAIKDINPNLNLDPPDLDITVVHRVKGSSSTDSITKVSGKLRTDFFSNSFIGLTQPTFARCSISTFLTFAVLSTQSRW